MQSKDTTAPVAIAMLQELVERDGLHTALKNRNEKALAPILAFLVKNIQNPVYTELLIDVASVVIGAFASVAFFDEVAYRWCICSERASSKGVRQREESEGCFI